MNYEIISQNRSYLGEGIYWDDREKAYYYVDIMRKEFRRLKNGADELLYTFGDFVGFTAPAEEGGYMVGCGRDLLHFDPKTKAVKKLFSVDAGFDNNRFNDGKATPDGRIIAGTMNNALNEDDFAPDSDTGGLWSITAGKEPVRLMGGKKVPNGLAFSRDCKRMFHTDTFSQTIKEYAYDQNTGTVTFLRDVIFIPEDIGFPDGMTISDDDTVFAALWGLDGIWLTAPVTELLTLGITMYYSRKGL